MYKFTITAKMGFMYHIPGPDEDPDDPKTNTCPLDPVLENKLNMLAALPKQVFGMLVPKELPDVRALMPYSLRLPHARDALDCKFDMVGPVSVSQGQLDEVKAFHAAMMEGPQKKKDPKKVAEELKKLTAAARKALGDDLPPLEPEPESAAEPAAPAAAPQTPTQEQGSIEPASAPATATAQQHLSEDQASVAAAVTAASQPEPMEQDQPAVTTANAPLASQRVAGSAAAPVQQADKTPLLLQQSGVPQSGKTDDSLGKGKLAAVIPAAASSQLESGESHGAAKADDPAAASTADPEPARFDELTKFTEGQEDAENKFVSNYYMLPLRQWMDWEDPDDVMDDSSAEIDWEAVKHVKYGWKPLSTLQEVSAPQQEPMDVMQAAGEQTTPGASADAQPTSCTARHTMCEGKAESTVVQADQPVADHARPESTLLDRGQANPDKGTSAFSIQEGAQAVPNNYKPLRDEQTAPSKMSKCLAAAAATTPAGDVVAPSNSHKQGQLDYWRLTNSVVVTTYNSTPYFFEDIDPVLTPESKFPEEKLKLQVVFEEEEEDEFLKPKPPKETYAPTDKPGQSSDKAKEAESAPAVATPAVIQEQDDMVTKLTASRKAATFTQYFKYVHMHSYA